LAAAVNKQIFYRHWVI